MSYLRLDRKMLSWEWKDDPNMVALWIEILLQANWDDRPWHGEVYEAGSFPTSVAKLSQGTGLSTQSVRTCLNKLEKTKEITIKSTKAGTKIIVNKWADFQCCDDEPNKPINKPTNNQVTNEQQTTNNQLTTLEEVKKERKKRNINNITHLEPEVVDGTPEFTEAFDALLEVRKAKKVPNTDRAVKQILTKLDNLAPNDEKRKIELLNIAVERGWSTVFEPYDSKPKHNEEKKGLEALLSL